MLTLKANLERKPTDFDNHFCQIEKIIELQKDEFDSLVSHPYYDRDFISENRDLMGQRNGAYHCLLVLGEGGNDGILIEAEGAGYIRYGAYVSHARDFVERELERTAAFFLKDISPDPETGNISIYLEDIAEQTGVEVRDDSDIARMFYRILKDHPSISDVEPVDDCLVVTPKSADAHSYISEHQRGLIDQVLGYFGEYHNSNELYDILHGSLEMSREDIKSLGFDISHIYESVELSHPSEDAAADPAQAQSMMGPTL